MGQYVLDAKNPSALVIPAAFLHQELPIRLSHALKLLSTNILPHVNISELPTFQRIARSYLEDIRYEGKQYLLLVQIAKRYNFDDIDSIWDNSLVTRMPKPSTPKLESEFTSLLRDLERRHQIKIMAVQQGVHELMQSVKSIEHHDSEAKTTDVKKNDAELRVANRLDPAADQAIQTFFDTFYTLNIGTRLLIRK